MRVHTYFRRRVPLSRDFWLNLSKSGVSASARKGRATVNTRKHWTVRLLKGFGLRGTW